jgi:two-component system chemotaxis response regulator CheB
MDALAAGALAIITKPKLGVKQFLQDAGNDLVSAVRAAARANMSHLTRGAGRALAPPPKLTADAMLAAQAASTRAMAETTDRVVAIGTSTGGTQALEAVLTKLPNVGSGIVIVQHMPEKFTAMFADRLNSLCKLEVREAQNGDRIMLRPCPDRAGRPPHDAAAQRRPVLRRSRRRPAGESAQAIGRCPVPLRGADRRTQCTGRDHDRDGRRWRARHEGNARRRRAHVAEDESTCIVFGMPKEAIRMGGVDRVVPLDAIPAEIISYG